MQRVISDQNAFPPKLGFPNYVPLDEASKLLHISPCELLKYSKQLPIYAKEFRWQMLPGEPHSNWQHVYWSVLTGINRDDELAYFRNLVQPFDQSENHQPHSDKSIVEIVREEFEFKTKADLEKFFLANSWVEVPSGYSELGDQQLEHFLEFNRIPWIILENSPPEANDVGSITIAFLSHLYVDGASLNLILNSTQRNIEPLEDALSTQSLHSASLSQTEIHQKITHIGDLSAVPLTLDALGKVLLKMMDDGITSAPEVWKKLRREATNDKTRKYDRDKIILQFQESSVSSKPRDQTLLWNKGGKEARCKYDSLKNRLTKVRKLAKTRE